MGSNADALGTEETSWFNNSSVFGCAAVGMYHTTALTDNMSVISCGNNQKGQLGVGKDKIICEELEFVHDPRTAGLITPSPSWKSPPRQIACGALHTVLLLANGDLYVWGFADSGRLGLSRSDLAIANAAQVATSPRPMSPRYDNSENAAAIGLKPQSPRSVVYLPVKVSSITDAQRKLVYVACGADFTLCIDHNGDAWSWGVGTYGSLGHGVNQNESEPRLIETLKGKKIRMVAGGAKHSACVSSKGELFTWGHGDKGRLGHGGQHNTSLPGRVQSLQHEFCAFVSCGEAHTAVISDSGELYTFGAGSYGRLGHGAEFDALTPVKVEHLVGHHVVMVSLGVFHSLAVTQGGDLWAWGGGQHGKLGLENANSNALVPQLIPMSYFGNRAVVQAFAGLSHSVAVCVNGDMYTWGDPTQGKLGHPIAGHPSAPQLIYLQGKLQGLRVATPKGGTSPTLATEAGTQNESPSQITVDEPHVRSLHPHRSINVSSTAVRMIAVGSKHTLALTFNGAVHAWGANEFGQIGNGSREDVRSPVRVKINHSTTNRAVHIAAGANHSLCVLNQGDTFAWGRGNESQIGTGSTLTETIPVFIQGLQGERVIKVFGGATHSGALTEDGRLFTWGNSDQGKLGHGPTHSEADPTFDSLALPRHVKGLLERVCVMDVSLGTHHSACIDIHGKVYTWGSGWQGKLGLGTTENQDTPQRVLALQFLNISAVSCGACHTLFVTSDGDVYVCGRGDARLGLGETSDRLIPQLNTFLRSAGAFILKACAAEEHSLAMAIDGRVWAWGKDAYGKLGLGRAASQLSKPSASMPSSRFMTAQAESIPQVIESSTLNLNNDRFDARDDVRQVEAYSNHCVALGQDSRLYSWGSNGNGRLGLEHGILRVDNIVDLPRPIPHFQVRTQGLTVWNSSQAGVGNTGMTPAEAIQGGLGGSMLGAGRGPPSIMPVPDNSVTASFDILGAAAIARNSRQLDNAKDIEIHIRDFLETGKIPPLFIVQYFLKAEPKERQNKGIETESREKDEAEASLYHTLLRLIRAEREVSRLDYTIGLTVGSTIRRLNLPNTVGSTGSPGVPSLGTASSGFADRPLRGASYKMGNTFKGGTLKGNTVKGGTLKGGSGGINKTKSRSKREMLSLASELVTQIPAFEKVFILLLANPRYMMKMYRIYVAQQQPRAWSGSMPALLGVRNGNLVSQNGGTGSSTPGAHTSSISNIFSEDSGFTPLPKGPEWRELYFDLVESVYKFGDPHCDHLFIVLARFVLREELATFMKSQGSNSTNWSSFPRKDSIDTAEDSKNQHNLYEKVMQQARDARNRPSLKSFMDNSKTATSAFVELATRFFAQESVTIWLRDSFGTLLVDLFRGHQSRLAIGEETNLTLDPIKIYNELQGVQQDPDLAMSSTRTVQRREEYANYPEVRRELEKRLALLKEVTLKILNQIVRVAATMPNEVRLFFKIYQDELQKQFEYDVEAPRIRYDQAVAKFFIDHLLRPAFLSPKQRRLVPRNFGTVSPQQHQNMIQVIKLLQAVVCDRPFRKEQFEALNISIRQHHLEVQTLANDITNAPIDIGDALYTDIITEYIRPRRNLLQLQVSRRSLHFVRFVLFHPSARKICSVNDPLACIVSETGGILASVENQVDAENFPASVDAYQDQDEDQVKVNIDIEMRFLELDADIDESKITQSASEASGNLRAGLQVDRFSRVPVPSWMLGHEAKSDVKVESIGLGQVNPDVEQVKHELVELSELPPTCDWEYLRGVFETRLEEEVKEHNYERAGEIYRVIERLNELSETHGHNAYDNLLRQLLSSLNQRRKSANRLQNQLASARVLKRRAEDRLKELNEQSEALHSYMKFLQRRSATMIGPAEFRAEELVNGGASPQTHSHDEYGSDEDDQHPPSSGKQSESNNSIAPSASNTASFKRSNQAAKLRSAILSVDLLVGAFKSITLSKLCDRGVITHIGFGAGASSKSIASSALSSSISSTTAASSSRRPDRSQKYGPSHVRRGIAAEAYVRNKMSIRLHFYSTDTGFFTVFVLLQPDTLLDQFEVNISNLVDMERVMKQTVRPSSSLPFEFSVTQFKILLEEITMKMLDVA